MMRAQQAVDVLETRLELQISRVRIRNCLQPIEMRSVNGLLVSVGQRAWEPEKGEVEDGMCALDDVEDRDE